LYSIRYLYRTHVKYIDENLNEKILVSDTVKLTRWDSQHFNRLFLKYIGVTPHKYILEKKIEKAKTMITETSIPIYQISFDLGFKSYSNFSHFFLKYMVFYQSILKN